MRSSSDDEALRGVHLPLWLSDGTRAVVREISAAGFYMEADAHCRLATRVLLEVHAPGTPMKFVAEGVVVRVEPAGQRVGVHVRFTSLRMQLPR